MSGPTLEISKNGGFYSVDNADTLIVLMHAFASSPKNMQKIAEAVREQCAQSDIFAPRLPFNTFSLADPTAVATSIVEYIEQLQTKKYRDIVLIGHSMGAVIARKVWVLAHGATEKATIDQGATRIWAKNISRIVLLSALNRGWMISSALNPEHRLLWTLGTVWGNVCRHVFQADPVIFGFQRGAPFLTLARLQCLALSESIGDQNAPIIVQLLGTADDLVAPTDNIDMASGGSFLYIEVADATHKGIINLDEGGGRALSAFRIAFSGKRAEIESCALDPEDVFDLYDIESDDHDTNVLPQASAAVQEVVFVVHGIRDRGFWTRRIAREIKTYARKKNKKCRTVTSTYGYFAMGPFLLPWVRRSKVQWLLDQYVTARSLYPEATISYVGHSNGTYLLAKALSLCPAFVVKRVVFAGSVVRTDFRWQDFMPRQVEQVVNYVATRDWVVAIFPNGLQTMRQDIGGAGHYGFEIQPGVTDVKHVLGSHGAALSSRRWKEMAAFVIDGELPSLPIPAPEQPKWAKFLGHMSPFLCIVLVAAIIVGFVAIIMQFSLEGRLWLLAFLVLLFAARAVLTKL